MKRDLVDNVALRRVQGVLRLLLSFAVYSALAFLLSHCSSEGESGDITLARTPSQQLSQNAIQNLLDLYSTALRQEDIDRLQEILQPTDPSVPETALRQAADEAFMDAESFRQSVTNDLKELTFLDLQTVVQRDDIQVDSEPPQVTFFEVESVLDGRAQIPTQRTQRTLAMRTTFRLARQETESDDGMQGITTFYIAGVARQGPEFRILTPGLLLAGEPATVVATETMGTFSLTAVTLETCEESAPTLANTAEGFQGVFTPQMQSESEMQSLDVCFHGLNQEAKAEKILVTHHYRVRRTNAGMVQKIEGTDLTGTAFFAVAIAPDGTVTGGGGDGLDKSSVPVLYQVPRGDTTACLLGRFSASNSNSRVGDLVYDDLGRLHAIVVDSDLEEPPDSFSIRGDIVVFDANDIDGDQFLLCPLANPPVRPTFCQTVNPFDANQDYPLPVENPEDGTGEDFITRATKASEGDIWIFGSNGGVAQVQDSVGRNQCAGVEVQYGPVFRRQNSDIPTNSVPALVVGSDGSLGFGTALGFTLRLPTGQFMRAPFDPAISLRGNPETLEGFFQAVAEAIFAARPLTTVALRGTSFVEEFGAPLVKEDIIFTVVEEQQASDEVPRRFWLGTLGGGLRRLEVRGETLRDTMLFTRAQVERVDPGSGERTVLQDSSGISSNIIFALAIDTAAQRPEAGEDVQTIWAATDEGVSRIHVAQGAVTITNFSPLDGLGVPVRDVAVTAEGVVWLATDKGLFRIIQ